MRPHPLYVLALAATFGAVPVGCASSGASGPYTENYDLDFVPRYTPEKPPRCPYEEVGMLDYGGRYGSPNEGADQVERRWRHRERREEDIRAVLNETGADAIFRSRAGHLVFLRFTDDDCLE